MQPIISLLHSFFSRQRHPGSLSRLMQRLSTASATATATRFTTTNLTTDDTTSTFAACTTVAAAESDGQLRLCQLMARLVNRWRRPAVRIHTLEHRHALLQHGSICWRQRNGGLLLVR